MSLMTVTSGFLAIKPRVWVEGELLKARTSFLGRLFCLFAASRYLIVDRRRRKIGFERRTFWFLVNRCAIPFERVHYIDLDFSSCGTSWGSGFGGVERTDQVERFNVSLVLRDPEEEVRLFSFVGEGSCETGLAGVLLRGDSFIDHAGDQAEAAHEFLDLLKEWLGVSIGLPVEHLADETGTKYFCQECGRPNGPSRTTCLYCGGPVAAGGEPPEV